MNDPRKRQEPDLMGGSHPDDKDLMGGSHPDDKDLMDGPDLKEEEDLLGAAAG